VKGSAIQSKEEKEMGGCSRRKQAEGEESMLTHQCLGAFKRLRCFLGPLVIVDSYCFKKRERREFGRINGESCTTSPRPLSTALYF